ncbi:hypothetical protein DSCO28_33800 [Desulfosarcina ovata subsp. sediminis]|uniref:LysM domain-containing protein n=1 Tax=Desulfosarcina ovata subsp. sediminis TaxID=885957 RepID=A0A5K7ZMM5_9BACT|nr:lytic transglycosylase domain-containing protein [Desulfosarcina ovata]BBO82814.1 hypothetical protein DSCO28_33800 [Desulfosarcina ovata subsp. sediminis]
MIFKWLSIWIAVASLMLTVPVLPGHTADPLFPEYPEITANVAFWTDIYATYPTTRAVVHDSLRLNIVYDVIDLEPVDHPGSRKVNRRRMKAARLKYGRILKRLAADPQAKDTESERVAGLFGPRATARTFDHARHRVRCQIGQRDRFRSGLIRSGAYFDQMRAIFQAYGLPGDLAYLPHVESSFDTRVTSKSGAAGMWQFTRSTGRRFLTVDHMIDERRDPIAATHAAAQLLMENYAKLGSWPLAITAYNHGAAGMQRAKAAHGSYPAIFSSYRGRTFKFASRNFYSEFLAARQVAVNYPHYFGQLTLKTPVPLQTLPLDGYVAWADLCRHLECHPQVLQALNPALMPPVLSGQKYLPRGYVLNLPRQDPFEGAEPMAVLPLDLFKPAQRASRYYTVRAGDTAGKIARMHRVRVADLVLANNLDHRATVYLRQRLRIPHLPTRTSEEKRFPASSSSSSVVENAAVKSSAAGKRPAILDTIPVECGDMRYRRSPISPI